MVPSRFNIPIYNHSTISNTNIFPFPSPIQWTGEGLARRGHINNCNTAQIPTGALAGASVRLLGVLARCSL